MMFWLSDDERPWFRAKSYGFGAGLPIAWQGWLLLALHVALIIGVSLALKDKPVAQIAVIMIVALLPMPIYAARTEGGWHWRWGNHK
jgi:hypothetical protein